VWQLIRTVFYIINVTLFQNSFYFRTADM